MNREIGFSTTVEEYAHPDSGVNISLVGVCHISNVPEYYPSIQEILDYRSEQGAETHYEKVNLDPESEDIKNFSGGDVLKLIGFAGASALAMTLMRRDGCVDQYGDDGIVIRDDWLNHDVSIGELVGALQPRQVSALLAEATMHTGKSLFRSKVSKAKAIVEDFKEVSSKVDQVRNGIYVPSKREQFYDKYGMDKDDAVLHLRNERALKKMTESIESGSGMLTMLWGQMHIHAFSESLFEQGFEVVGYDELMAIDYAKFIADAKKS